MKIKLDLKRPARSKGGDRYEAQLIGEDNPLIIYFPQKISRPGGIPAKYITIDLEVSDE